jgi:Txe/YoeB family toxin of Txe-Axe toxin-antitoxin module
MAKTTKRPSRILKKIRKQITKRKRSPHAIGGAYEKVDFLKQGLYLKGSYSKLAPPSKRKRPRRKKVKAAKN